MCVSITPPEWYRNVIFGGPGPWTSGDKGGWMKCFLEVQEVTKEETKREED